MKTVTEHAMASVITELGGMALLHRFYENPLEDIPRVFKEIDKANVGVSVGVKPIDYDLVSKAYDA
jgi:hypothetical protein